MRPWIRKLVIVILLVFPAAIVFLSYLEDVAETGGQGPAEGVMSLVTDISRRSMGFASQAGYAGIFLLMLLEAAALPVPSEVILPFAGYLVWLGDLDFWPVVFYSTVAALIGSFIDYYLGWKIGRPFFTGKSELPFVDPAHLRRAQGWFDHYGPIAVAFLRLIPGARVLISFPAGAYQMSKTKFAFYTLAGCLPWNLTLVYLGWQLGSSWATIVGAFRYIDIFVYPLLVLLLVWMVWKLTQRGSRRNVILRDSL
jgi:membrane protein DedA with SNARE-associated domain